MSWSEPGLVDVPTHRDALGALGVVEGEAPFPFGMKRVYFLYDVPAGAVRGSHAHKALHQLIIAVAGSLTVRLDNGSVAADWLLETPSRGLIVPPGYWRTLTGFTPGAAALVLASEEYDSDDYIRDYEEFVGWVARE